MNVKDAFLLAIIQTDPIHKSEKIMFQYSDKTKNFINQIGSGDTGYIPKAITCAVKYLDKIAANEDLPEDVRSDAAFAAANLILSDYNDD